MAQCLRILAAIAEDWSSVPNTSGDSQLPVIQAPGDLIFSMYIHTETDRHTQYVNKMF